MLEDEITDSEFKLEKCKEEKGKEWSGILKDEKIPTRRFHFHA